MNIRLMLALVCLAGWLSTAVAGERAEVEVEIVDTPAANVEVVETPGPVQCITQRWESFIVDEPVTVMRKVRKWRLVDVPVTLDGPGPRPRDVIVQDVDVRTIAEVDCVPCERARVNVDVDTFGPEVRTVGPEVRTVEPCIGGNCVRRVLGQRAEGARVNVDVDTRPRRGLFWRLRR